VNPKEYQRRCQRIYQIGCLACRRRGYYGQPCQVHHLNLGQHAGQKRLGNESTVGLCVWHHVGQPMPNLSRQRTKELLGPSMALHPVKFREEFGDDLSLLAEQDRLISIAESRVIGRQAV
jgi:hypothetical protein